MIEYLQRSILSLLTQACALKLLMRPSRVTREEIVALQNKRLPRIITHAYQKVPYYRRLFDENKIKPEDIRTAADLCAIPISSKKDLQSVPVSDWVASDVKPDRLLSFETSGFTGEPVIIRRTWAEERLLSLFRQRARHYYGMQKTDKTARIGQIRKKGRQDNEFPLRILQALGFYRKITIDITQAPSDIVHHLLNVRPDILTGYAGILTRVAEIVANDKLTTIRPRFVLAGGEMLTPPMRSQISKAFSAPVFNVYGSWEFNLLAWECRETGELHTCDDGLILEVLKNGRPVAIGESGEVVGTNLHSFAMPFIRYRQGDIVIKGSETCRCGLPFSTIREIQGRMTDYFLLPGGRLVHPAGIQVPLLEAYPFISRYQMIQKREDLIALKIVPIGTIPSGLLEKIIAAISILLGKDVELKVDFVTEIPPEPGGKFLNLRSEVYSAYD